MYLFYHLYRLMVAPLECFPSQAARPIMKHGREIHDHNAFVGALCTNNTNRISSSTLGGRKSNSDLTAVQSEKVKLIVSETISKVGSSV